MPSSPRSCSRTSVKDGAWEPSIDAGPDGNRAITFEQYAVRWIGSRRAAGKVDWVHHERRLRLHAFPEFGGEPLASITLARMLQYVRSLRSRSRVDGTRELSSRTVKNIADSVRAVFADAVEDGLVRTSPCTWNARKHLPRIVDTDPLRRMNGCLPLGELRRLLSSRKVPRLRRTAYALEFLTGMRPGEVAALRVRDIELDAERGGRIIVRRAWSSDARVEGPTKTRVVKLVPIHPYLHACLLAWVRNGFASVFDRVPIADDLVVPAPRGGHRMASQTNREFRLDLDRLGLRRRVHSDSRATFRSLVVAARPDLERIVDLVTHPAPREAKDLYRRIDALWPRMCEAVEAIEVGPALRQRGALAGCRPKATQGVIRAALRALELGRVDLALRDLRMLDRRLGAQVYDASRSYSTVSSRRLGASPGSGDRSYPRAR